MKKWINVFCFFLSFLLVMLPLCFWTQEKTIAWHIGSDGKQKEIINRSNEPISRVSWSSHEFSVSVILAPFSAFSFSSLFLGFFFDEIYLHDNADEEK